MARQTFTGFDPETYRRSQECIAHGALTNSKRPECLVKGVYPTHLKSGNGSYVWDLKGNKYIDFICGLGSNLLGYANPDIVNIIAQQARKGVTLSLGTEIELLAAEKVKELFPFVERVRFLKTGSDACSAAIKIARAKTGRFKVLSEGYHGWADAFVSLTPPALGVPLDQYMRKLESNHQVDKDTAAVIVEPISTDISKERIEKLKALRKQCTEYGVLLIFDEIITGFRFPKFGVSNVYGIEPDLICLGKAIGNGMPLAVVGGKEHVMNCGEYFISSTFAGETLSLAAALQTMTLLQIKKYDINELWEKGKIFLDTFNAFWPEGITIEGYPTRGVFVGEPLTKALFWQEACRAGIIFGPSWFFNFSHIELSDVVLNTCKDILTRVKTGGVKLIGEMPASPFAQKVRGKQ